MESKPELVESYVRLHWHKPMVAHGFAVFLGISEYLAILLKTGDPSSFAGISIPVLTVVGILTVWWLTHRIPRCPDDKVGIVIAVVSDDAAEARQIESDFIREISTRFRDEKDAANFHVIVLPEFAATQVVHQKKHLSFLEKCNGRLMLAGFARRRIVEGKEVHVLDFDGAVRHAPLPSSVSEAFGREFREALPQKLIFPKDGDVFSFAVSSAWIELSVRYVIAIAAQLSGSFAYAERLFLAVENRLKVDGSESVVIKPIARDIPRRMIALYELWLRCFGSHFFLREKKTMLEAADEIAMKLVARDPSNYGGLLALALAHFSLRNDVKAARACLKGCEKTPDAAWRYSVAFLLAHEGNLGKARAEYKRAFRAASDDNKLPLGCEQWIAAFIRDNPDRRDLFFCTALINYGAKEDFVAARHDFELFIEHCGGKRNQEQVEFARDLIRKCEEKIPQSAGRGQINGSTSELAAATNVPVPELKS